MLKPTHFNGNVPPFCFHLDFEVRHGQVEGNIGADAAGCRQVI
jgi:hypothetical protein